MSSRMKRCPSVKKENTWGYFMKRTLKKFALLGAAAALSCAVLTGCSLGKPTISLNDYVTVSCEGRNGSGDVRVHIDYSQMVEDHQDAIEKKRINPVFGDETYSMVADMAFENNDPFDIEFMDVDKYSNGDQVEINISINDSEVRKIQEVFKANYKFKPFTYTVEGLAEIQEVDPFENVFLNCYGIEGSKYGVSISDYTKTTVFDPVTEQKIDISMKVQLEEYKQYRNGDTVHVVVDMDENRLAELEERNGIRLSRTEADVTIQDCIYVPRENPKEIFEHLDEHNEVRVRHAMMESLKEFSQDDGEPTLVGMGYVYDDEGHKRGASFNGMVGEAHLAFIYHLEDGNVDGGYYYYMLGHEVAVITPKKDENGNRILISGTEGGHELSDSQYHYAHDRDSSIMSSFTVPSTFDYNGAVYHGHLDINECVEAMLGNNFGGNPYDHFVPSDDLIANGYTG